MTKAAKIQIKRLIPGASFTAAAFFLYASVLRQDVLLFGNDTLYHDYIMLLYGWGKLRGGSLILWLPHIYSGIPFIGSFAFCPFYPLSWLFLVLPFPFAFNFQYALHGFLAGAFTYRLMRSFGLKRFPSTVGGLAFQLSGHFATLAYPGHLQKVQAIVWIPLALSLIHRAMYSGKKKYLLLTAAALAMPLLTSHPQIYYYGVCAVMLYALWCVGNRRRIPIALPPRQILPMLAVVLLLSMGLSSLQTLPGYETAAYSVRGGGLKFDDAIKSSYPPAELWELVLPRFLGDSIRGGYGRYWGWWGERLVSDYLGMAVVFLALVGSLISSRLTKFYFTFLFLLSTIIACGKYSPIFRLMYGYVPGMSHFRSPATVMFLMSLSAAVLAGFGLETIIARANAKTENGSAKKFTRKFLVAAGIFLLLTIFAHTYWLRAAGRAQQSEFYARLVPIMASVRRSLFFLSASLGALALFFHTYFLVKSGRLPYGLLMFVKIAVLIVFFIDPALNDRAFIQPEPIEPYHNYLFHSGYDKILMKEPPPARIHDLGNELSNRPLLNGIGVPLGYHPIEIRHYMEAWNAAHPGSLAAARLTSTAFLAAPQKIELGESLNLISRDIYGKALYRRKEPVPYAYIPRQLVTVRDEKALLKKMSADDFDPHETTYMISEIDAAPRAQNNAMPIRVLEYAENRIELECRFSEDALIATGDVWMPGWRASLEDGSPLTIARANHAFRGIEVPKGNHMVTMEYRPESFRYGIVASLLSLALWLALLIWFKKSKGEAPSCPAPSK